MICKTNDQIFNYYYKFLTTTEGADILPYAYLGAGDSYEKLIKNCKDYYLFDDEVALIKNNHLKLKHHLSEITNIIEIGPGSKHTVINKTIPILQYAKDLKSYLPIDLCQSYLTDACAIVKENIPGLNIMPIEHNIMHHKPLNINNIKGRRAIIFLGGTLGNFNEIEQNNILAQLYNSLEPDDLLFITFDTNLEESSLLKAYNNNFLYDILKGSLNYFSMLYPDLLAIQDKCEPCCVWNAEQHYIDLFFTAKDELTISLPNMDIIKICKGQELRGIKSRKYDKTKIVEFLSKNNFSVIDILDNSQKMQIFICNRA